MLNKLMSLINGLEERDLNEGITENDINELGFILIRNNSLLPMYNISIAGAFMANKEAIGRDDVPMIVVDDYFYSLSNNTKVFIIGHELGHFQSNHEKQYGGCVRKIDDEFEADEYGAKLVGYQSAIFAIEEMEDLFKNLFEGFEELIKGTINEFEIRIEKLLSKANITLC